MYQSQLFTKTRREVPKDEVSKNAQLLIRAGFVHKEIAGVYSYLPLGYSVLKKIEVIIREEMDAIGGQELLLTTLQDPEIWKKSGRWSDDAVDIWFKSKLSNGSDIGIANTHEEPLTNLLKQHVSSHKDLPLYIYQIQNKFRNELRVKSGLLRGREFVMKDLYSFSRNEKEHKAFYERCADAYMRIFERVGIGAVTYRTFASGGSFSKYSDEFQTLTEAGEDTIYLDRNRKIAVNKEVYTDEVLRDLDLSKGNLDEVRAIEVGNIFPLGSRFPEALGLRYKDEDGKERPIIMGSYGIGLGRLIGTVVEVLSDERGIVWPVSIAPYTIHILSVGRKGGPAQSEAERLYEILTKSGKDVLYDDRDVSAGEKFSESDLIGIPNRVIIGDKRMKEGIYECVTRSSGETTMLSQKELLAL